MDFELTADQKELREAARTFAREQMAPVAREIEATSEPLSREWKHKYGEMGFLGVNLPKEYGGLGLSDLDALLVLEQFVQVHPGVAFPIFEASVGPIKAIEKFGTDSLKKDLLPRVATGDAVVAVAMSEPEAGTALTDLKTRAEIKGDKVVVTGTKRWCSGGGKADGYLVYSRMGDGAGAKGIGAVYVPGDAQGLTFGKREQLMGFRGIYSADMFFDKVEVPLDHVVVPEGGFPKLMQAFDLERCGNSTMCLGIAQAALDEALAYVKERTQFGKPLIEFQAVQMKIAEMAMQVDAARLLIWRAVTQAEHGFPSIANSSIAKCFSNEMVRDVTGKAMQLMGGYGYSKEYPAEQRFRDAWGWGIAGGAIDIQKVNIAAALAGKRFDQRR
ncbi:acyl-CoA dehydrogenase family protein [Futiania mangrovi]|uniref:Acyl-CoA dehydrogenase family protein n=1 Tax=Futiania mangrovi TaxID=2959716 RepID=A0A9J6PBN3_9PROT|nr:acyl-CoA dehydrogenase family protein [Futiania mangrovii]MCP1336645.1 acyl-CoA dehydrogenase family protein [Futiania mangrovii]